MCDRSANYTYKYTDSGSGTANTAGGHNAGFPNGTTWTEWNDLVDRSRCPNCCPRYCPCCGRRLDGYGAYPAYPYPMQPWTTYNTCGCGSNG